MSKWNKILHKILMGQSDANLDFDDLRGIRLRLGFDERLRGSHQAYRKNGIEDHPNLQSSGSKAKPYQVRQIREIILKHKLGGDL